MFSKQTPLLVAALLVSASLLIVGCEQEVAVETQSKKPLPKLDFHKPANFDAAVARVRELHDAILSEGALPTPVSYTVVEVSHSHGNGNAHVHYHLDESADGHVHDENCDHGHDHDDGHSHVHEDPFQQPNKHFVSVDVFTELKDISRWLPAIASDGDLPQDKWKQAKTLSGEIEAHLETLSGAGMPSVQRASYKDKPESMEKWIVELEQLVSPATDQSQSE